MEQGFLNIIILIFSPLIAGLLIFLGLFRDNQIIIRRSAKWFMLLHFIYALAFLLNYNTNLQFEYVTTLPFGLFGNQGALITFAQDFLSSTLVVLCDFIIFICLLNAKSTVLNKHKFFYSFALFFSFGVNVMLMSQDLFLFALAGLFEVFCAYILILNFTRTKFQNQNKRYLILNFFAFSFLVLTLCLTKAIFAKYQIELDTTNLINSADKIMPAVQFLTFLAFLICSAIKLPIIGLHKPILEIFNNSGASLGFISLCEFTLGFFILVKYNFYCFAKMFEMFLLLLIILGLISLIYFIALAIKEIELKKSLAYFTFSQIALSLTCLSTITQEGVLSAVFQFVSICIVALGLFLCANYIYNIFKTQKIIFMGDIATKTPDLAILNFILILAGIGFPLTSGFIARFLCLLAPCTSEVYSQNLVWIIILAIVLNIVLCAIYLLKTFQEIYFKKDNNLDIKPEKLLRHRFYGLLSVCLITVFLGIMPYVLLSGMSKYCDMILCAFSI